MAKQALITGANGITGSAIARYLVENTTKEEWSRIFITSRSPLQLSFSDPRMEFIALDFSKPPEELAASLKTVAKDVTHAYFSSYVHRDDFAELNSANSQLFENFLSALVQTAPKLENVTLQTGGKHYNVHLGPVDSPAREEEPRRQASIDNFYFPQEDALIAAAKKNTFSWNVIRPEAIIGTTNKPNGMNEALTIAMYLIVCAELGEEAVMPTNQRYWEGTEDVSASSSIADLTIFASTHSNCKNQAFNHNNGDYFTWRYMWPRLAAHFGAKASSDYHFKTPYPKEGELALERSLAQWSQGKEAVWHKICDKHNAPEAKATWSFGTWAFQDWVFQRTWSATMSINKARKFGWTHHVDSYDSFIEAFKSFEFQSMIPSASRK